MVWHTHMLNPRAYLEDCIRTGRRALWLGGLPWATVNAAIDNTTFAYNAQEAAKTRWERATGLQWENTECPMTKQVSCPSCTTTLDVPWTTWNPSTPEPTDADFAGSGYGDGDLRTICPSCSYLITKDGLCAVKFINDAKKLLSEKVPMAGTVLTFQTGIPSVLKPDEGHYTFPNHLLLRNLREETLLEIFGKGRSVTMDDVRGLVEELLEDLEPLDDLIDVVDRPQKPRFLLRYSRMAVRKMFGRYNGNHSALGLDLVPAVVRQSAFIDKMFKV